METLCNSRAVCVWAILTFVAILPFAQASQGRGVNSAIAPLKFDLPAPGFGSTPPNLAKIPNLEPVGKTARPPFYAPAGATNLALGKPVASTDDLPIIGELEMITDGDKRAQDGSFVELGPSAQHVTIDLEEVCEIYAILVWHWHKQPRVYFDVAVQIADDADFITNVRTVFNNDTDNSAGLGIGSDKHYVDTHQGRLIDAKGQRARYIRLHSNGNQANDLNHYTEVEVWGHPAITKTPKQKFVRLEIDYPEPGFAGENWHLQNYKDYDHPPKRPPSHLVPVGTKNVALGKKVSSSDPKPIIGKIEMIIDGTTESDDGTLLEIGPGLQHVTVDLGAGHELSAIVLWRAHHWCRVYHDVIIQVATDPHFTNAVTLFNNDRDNSAGLGKGSDREYIENNFGKLIDAAGVVARYVRAWSNGCVANEFNQYVELAVYGRPADAKTNPHGPWPLNFQLPGPLSTSHPPSKLPPHTEKSRHKPRAPFLAPRGTRIVSLHKPVTGSDDNPAIGTLEMVTDGRKDGAKGAFLELTPGLQYVTIDLEDEYEIHAVLFWHFTWQRRVYYDVIVRTADDMDFTENVHTLFNNDIDNSAGLGVGDDMHYIDFNEGKIIDAGGVTARYLRLYSNGNTSNKFNHYVEVEVWAHPGHHLAD